MRRLKILFLPTWYPSLERPVDGVFIQEHAKAVSGIHDVAVLHVAPGTGTLPMGWEVADDQMREGIRTVRVAWRCPRLLGLSYFFRFWVIMRAYQYMCRAGFVPDAIHGHVCPMALPAVVLGRLHRVPVFISEHWSGFVVRKVPLRLLWEAKLAFPRADRVLPVSEFLLQNIKTYGIAGSFRVVPNVVNTGLFYPGLAKTEGCAGRDYRTALTVSSLSEAKGIPVLLEAVKRVNERGCRLRLDIVGDGPQRLNLERNCRDLGLDTVVSFLGAKPRPEVADMMRSCDFFVMSSLWETFGVVNIEAMACGKPIVATQIPAFLETITEDTGVLVPPDDAEALAGALVYMMDHFPSYSADSIAAYARQRFGPEVVAGQLNEVYQETARVG